MKMRSDKLSGCARFIIVSLFCGHFSKRLFYRVFGAGRRALSCPRSNGNLLSKSCKNKKLPPPAPSANDTRRQRKWSVPKEIGGK
jgi:hypothetical protein